MKRKEFFMNEGESLDLSIPTEEAAVRIYAYDTGYKIGMASGATLAAIAVLVTLIIVSVALGHFPH